MLIQGVLTLSLVKLSIKLKLKQEKLILKPQDLSMPSQSEAIDSVVGCFLDQCMKWSLCSWFHLKISYSPSDHLLKMDEDVLEVGGTCTKLTIQDSFLWQG